MLVVIIIISIIVFLFFIFTFFSEIFKYPSIIKIIQKSIDEGNIEEARVLVKKIPLRKRKDPYALWIKAQLDSESGQYILAMSGLQDILYKNFYTHGLRESDVRATLVDIYQKTGRKKEAFELLERMKFQNRNDIFANSNLGKSYFKDQMYDDAEVYLLEAVNSGSMDAEVYYMLSNVLYIKNKLALAMKYLKVALKLRDNYFYAQMLEGIIEYESANYKIAEEIFSKLKSWTNQKTLVLAYISLCKYALGYIEDSLSIAENIISLLDNKSIIYNALLETMANAYIETGKILEVEPVLKKLIKIDPNNDYARSKIKMYKYVFEYPDKLLSFVNTTEYEFLSVCKSMVESFDYIIDETIQTLNQVNIICHPKKTRHNTMLMIFSRLARILEVKDLNFFAKLGSDRHVSLVYVFTPFIFSVECIGFNNDRLVLECYNGKDFAKVISHEDVI